MSDRDLTYRTDDDGNIVGCTIYNPNGTIDEYNATEKDLNTGGHTHEKYSTVDKYSESIDDSFAGNDTSGDIYSRGAEKSEGHTWVDRDGVF